MAEPAYENPDDFRRYMQALRDASLEMQLDPIRRDLEVLKWSIMLDSPFGRIAVWLMPRLENLLRRFGR